MRLPAGLLLAHAAVCGGLVVSVTRPGLFSNPRCAATARRTRRRAAAMDVDVDPLTDRSRIAVMERLRSKGAKTADDRSQGPRFLVVSSENDDARRLRYKDFRDEERKAGVQTVPWARGVPADEAAADAAAAEANKRAWMARAMLVGVAALYGTNFGCVKILQEALPPPVAAALRFSLAALVFAPALRGAKWEVVKGGLEVGTYVGAGYLAQSVALTTTTASKSAFICSLAVVFVPLLSMLLEQLGLAEKEADEEGGAISGGGMGAVAARLAPATLAAAGVAALELGGLDAPNVGDLWSMLQPICFGLGFWRTEQLTRKYPEGTKQLTAAQLLAVAGAAVTWVAFSSSGLPAPAELLGMLSDWHIPAALVWTGVVTTAFTVYLEAQAMKDLSAAESTVIFSTEPLWGTAFAAAALGEHIGWNTGVGALLILSACVWSSVGPSFPFANLLLATSLAAENQIPENIAGNIRDMVQSFCDASGIE